MSLWGKNDNKLSDGTVTVNHANRTVIGSGTTFGSVGCGATGDIIRFGQPLAGSAGYLGEAVIVAIGGTQSIVIDSTAGISPTEITGENYQITQSPKSTVTDAAFNKFSRGIAQKGDVRLSTTLNGNVAIGATILTTTDTATGNNIAVGDEVIITHGNIIPREQHGTVHSVATNTIRLANALLSTHSVYKTDGEAYGTGVNIVNLQEAPVRAILDGGAAGAHLDDLAVGDTFTVTGTNTTRAITAISNAVISGVPTKIVTLAGNLQTAIPATVGGASVLIKRGAITGSSVVVRAKESVTGDETQTVGVGTQGVQDANQTQFETSAGWVGVTTYNDMHGNLRVKKEVLVAMGGDFGDPTAGIETGNLPIYDGNPFA